MAWSSTFLSGISEIMKVKKIDPPVSSAFKNVQSFGQSVDSAEKMGAELKSKFDAAMKIHKEYQAAAEEYNKLVTQWNKLESAIDTNMKTYQSSLATYEKQGREYGEKEYMTGCVNMRKGLDNIESQVEAMSKHWGPMKIS